LRGTLGRRVAALAIATSLVGAALASNSDPPLPPEPTADPAQPPKDEPVSNPAPPDRIVPPSCFPCDSEDPGLPVRFLSVEQVAAVGRVYADSNVVRLAWVDSLLQSGKFGDPKSGNARKQAHLLARMLTLNAYSYMIRFGTDPDTIWEANEETMAPAFATFSDPGIVPLARLRRARMGRGRMCAEYDLSETMRSETVLGGRRLAVRIQDVRIQGRTVRALVMDLPTSLHSVVEVWITEHVCIDVQHYVSEGPPGPFEAFVLDNMQGMWVHRAGLHRPQAFVFWVTPRAALRNGLPEKPLVGARIYVPRLELRLPSILPDIGFEDLREVDLPQPILALDYISGGQHPRWLQPAEMRGFKNWDGVGALPPELRRRFPDY
jgi:hypothetical protein